jgi:hypothetical protein
MPSQSTPTLSIDPKSDDLRPVAELVKQLTGRRPSPASVWRWTQKGTRRAGKLPAIRVFGQQHTTREALLQWLQTDNVQSASTADDCSSERSPETESRLKDAGLL